ncbi:MAG: hypothetical protein ABI134_36415 [Byssovorax sp.]
MTSNPALDEFERQLLALRKHKFLAPHMKREEIHLGALTREEIADLAREEVAYYFLIAAAGLNRTSLKRPRPARLPRSSKRVFKKLM